MPCRSPSLVLLLAAIIILPASAQLSGNYTVDSTLPTGGGNYNTLIEAAAALTAQGVSGPVTFSIYNGTGPYVGFGIAGPITGSSATNTVTFLPALGQTPVISGPTAGNVQTIKLGNADHRRNRTGEHRRSSGSRSPGPPTGAGIFAGRGQQHHDPELHGLRNGAARPAVESSSRRPRTRWFAGARSTTSG